MIFSKQKIEYAFTHMSKYYNKILKIDLDNDTFEPIKVNDKEWNKLEELGIKSYSDWVAGFFDSAFYSSKGDTDHVIKSILTLRDVNKLREQATPINIEYKKVIDGVFHEVMLEYLPIGNNQAFLFVKNLYLMEKGIYENEI